MKQRIRVKLSPKLLAKLRKMQVQPPGLRWVPELGQPTPERPEVAPEVVDPVTAILDGKGVIKGAS